MYRTELVNSTISLQRRGTGPESYRSSYSVFALIAQQQQPCLCSNFWSGLADLRCDKRRAARNQRGFWRQLIIVGKGLPRVAEVAPEAAKEYPDKGRLAVFRDTRKENIWELRFFTS